MDSKDEKEIHLLEEEIKTNDIDNNKIKKENKNEIGNDIIRRDEILNEKIHINNIIKEKDKKNNSDEDVNQNNIKERSEYLTVEDLLKYINGSEVKKKKKRKRKKKKKIEEKNNNKNFEEKDEIIESFKSYIINFSENLEKNQKIKPNISQSFLDKL